MATTDHSEHSMAISVQRFPLWFLALTMAVHLTLATTATAAPEKTPILETQKGKATYYGKKFHGRKTSSGEKFHNDHPVAAHPTWPFGTLVRVTNLANGKTLTVRIIDRGPSRRQRRKGIIIDVSRGAAKVLGFIKQGIARVRLDVIKWGPKVKK
jgi:rare lipoprotein A